MFVFNGKKIIFITGCLIISIFTFLVSTSFPKTVIVSSTPVSNSLIILDAGHGLPDSGAVSLDGTSEESINLSITLKLQELLEQSSCYTMLTRSDENGIYNKNSKTVKDKKISDLKNRVNLINSNKSNLLISIHLNKFNNSKYYGWQTFYRPNDNNSKILATNIQNNLNLSIQKNNKREPLEIKNKYIIDNTTIPAVIVECGFLSNERETELLKSSNYQDKIAWGIYAGIIDYIKEQKK